MQHVWISQGSLAWALAGFHVCQLTLSVDTAPQVPSLQHGVLKNEDGAELRMS